MAGLLQLRPRPPRCRGTGDQDLGYSHIRGSETARRIDVKASSAPTTFSPDSKHLAFTTSPGSTRYEVRPAESEDSITIWDIATDQQENFSGEQEGPIRAITFSPNQKKLVPFSEPWAVVVWKLEIKSTISKLERLEGVDFTKWFHYKFVGYGNGKGASAPWIWGSGGYGGHISSRELAGIMLDGLQSRPYNCPDLDIATGTKVKSFQSPLFRRLSFTPKTECLESDRSLLDIFPYDSSTMNGASRVNL
ncbi:hypothetical protein TWF569_003927 [Orbilia oligospora]|nr:hypothetical protein TWF103_001570 [Orbilia oligospora]KAF3157007.1 hypothetical protein TWF569_003927 [Orbilia oligospora]